MMRVTSLDIGVKPFIKTYKTLMLNMTNPGINHEAGLLNLAHELNNVSRACSDTETADPGCLGSKDSFCAGNS
jgi:hypothetical protein